MFRDRRRLRSWATRMLLVWLFGLATGIAHACISRMTVAHHDGDAVVDVRVEFIASHGHDQETPNASQDANCLDFCEKASVTAPSSKLKLGQSVDIPVGAVLASPVPWRARWAILIPSGWIGLVADWGEPPSRIAFQRLAL